ncbi:MAG: hypothetical protein WB729_06705 [Candidatus Sulfotelmatobacter sp.]
MFACGKHWHIGRSNSYAVLKPLPPAKIPSRGQLLRLLRKIDDQLLKELKHRAHIQKKIIEADERREYEFACAAVGIQP